LLHQGLPFRDRGAAGAKRQAKFCRQSALPVVIMPFRPIDTPRSQNTGVYPMSSRSRALPAIIASIAVISTAVAWQTGSQAPEPASNLLPVLQNNAPRYWKGNLHTHSFWSDGDDFPEMIADWYKRHGYHFLTLSDHHVLSEGDRWLNATKDREPILQKYRDRFGERWVEERDTDKGTQVRLKPLAEFR